MSLKIRLARAGAKKRPSTGSWLRIPAAPATAAISRRSAPTIRYCRKTQATGSSWSRIASSIGSASARSRPTACSASSTRQAFASVTPATIRRRASQARSVSTARKPSSPPPKRRSRPPPRKRKPLRKLPPLRRVDRARRSSRRSPGRGTRRSRRRAGDGIALSGKDRVLLGDIGAAHGLKGEVRLRSFTEAPAAIADYGPLEDETGGKAIEIESVRPGPKGLIARIKGVTTREGAEALTGTKLYVPRDRLPRLRKVPIITPI